MDSGLVPSLTRSHPDRPALWFPFARDRLLVRVEADTLRPLSDDDARALGLAASDVTWVGALDGCDCAAVRLPADLDAPDGYALHGLRTFFTVWPAAQVLTAGAAAQLLDFEATHAFCGRCATPTVPEPKERARRCPSCGLVTYPRISPAVIVLVRRGREALLAHSGRFALPVFSTLAGFVEVGESLEDTVAREIREEVGIEVRELRYLGSQPWPFPHSLMVGYFAEYAGGDIRVDGQEILEARWFAPEALPMIPPPLSIARRLIDAWVSETTSSH